ncbi:hypothetical protein BQ8482_480015 [Mesorhizobium delmotii]|uniref:Uncharacterized protein n=1 Tax=Mesorhizobium delmotii TaxID=1631247 RepID=A0A2P9ATP7_9HYPH|nr:hypothetical protein BQ8482_480015 [Mesorhizobium delmotii]
MENQCLQNRTSSLSCWDRLSPSSQRRIFRPSRRALVNTDVDLLRDPSLAMTGILTVKRVYGPLWPRNDQGNDDKSDHATPSPMRLHLRPI